MVLPGLVRVRRSSAVGLAEVSPSGVLRGAFNLCQAEIEDLGMSAFRDEDVGRLDIAMDDSLGVRCFKSIGDFNGERQQGVGVKALRVTMCFMVMPSRYSMAMKG